MTNLIGLDANQLADMRADVAQTLPDTIQIQSVSRASDGAGGWTETWTTVNTYPCRVDPLDMFVQFPTLGEREALINSRKLTLAWNASIAVGQRGIFNGDTYEIRDLQEDHSWRVSRRALITKIKAIA